jgi:desulfoferrodoxin (superoxide reductase-like protein)
MINIKIIFLISILLVAVALNAHPADKMLLQFDPVEKILTVTIDHSVKNVENHYIGEITVKLNKKEIITQKFDKQDDLNKTTVIYKIIDANPDDTISVISKCNKFGKKSEKIIIKPIKVKKND